MAGLVSFYFALVMVGALKYQLQHRVNESHRPAILAELDVVMAQAGDVLALELAAWVQADRVADRLVGDRFFGVVGPHGRQYVRNLRGKPALLQIC
jgi:hypothetical protein